MALADLANVLKIFGGSECTPEERAALFKEALLMTLSRATSADSNIDPAEVATVRAVLQETTGDDVSDADIRIAANSGLYEKASLDKYLAKSANDLEVEQRVTILHALAKVIRSDQGIREREVEFFNMIAGALQITPAQLAGLNSNAP